VWLVFEGLRLEGLGFEGLGLEGLGLEGFGLGLGFEGLGLEGLGFEGLGSEGLGFEGPCTILCVVAGLPLELSTRFILVQGMLWTSAFGKFAFGWGASRIRKTSATPALASMISITNPFNGSCVPHLFVKRSQLAGHDFRLGNVVHFLCRKRSLFKRDPCSPTPTPHVRDSETDVAKTLPHVQNGRRV
jgi:hypothetical protein